MLLSCPAALLPRPPFSRVRPSHASSVRAPPCALVRRQPRATRAILTRPAAFVHLSSCTVGSTRHCWSPMHAP